MKFYLDLYRTSTALRKKEFDEIMTVDEKAKNNNIILTRDKVEYIIDSHKSALRNYDRIEFGENLAKKILDRFCESPYVKNHNVHTVVESILEIFYCVKSETETEITDNEIIDKLFMAYENECSGSVELLYDWAVQRLIRAVNFKGMNDPYAGEDRWGDSLKDNNTAEKEESEDGE